jgi:DNA-directed RNA polymerase specialized sigma24 family protein
MAAPCKPEKPADRTAFDRFLAWFDYNRDRAAANWLRFRKQLVCFFQSKGRYGDAEDCAEEVLSRALRRFEAGGSLDAENAKALLQGYANHLWLEQAKVKREVPADANFTPADSAPGLERSLAARETLSLIQQGLSADEFELLVEYHADLDRADLAKWRAKLAAVRGKKENALRVQIRYIKDKVLKILGNSKNRESDTEQEAQCEHRS